jgi:hypothetical protein
MSLYRAYAIGTNGHITRPPQIIEAHCDRDALELARQFVAEEALELWDAGRLIGRVERSSSSNLFRP